MYVYVHTLVDLRMMSAVRHVAATFRHQQLDVGAVDPARYRPRHHRRRPGGRLHHQDPSGATREPHVSGAS